MATGDWNFSAGRLLGDGTIDILETELPINVTNLDRTLSTPSGMTGSITNAALRYKVNGRPIFEDWNTVILAEASDQLRGMAIYRRPTWDNNNWNLDLIGMSGYVNGMPYDGSKSYIDADPMDIYREVWNHLQSMPDGNIGVTVDSTVSPIRVGTNDEPRQLNLWDTADLAAVVDELAKETPFDWRERVYWLFDQPHCHIELAYPAFADRTDHLRLVLGENLATVPSVSTAEYVNQAYVLGAGEGYDRIRGYAGVRDGKLRRAKVVQDEGRDTVERANSLAYETLNAARGQLVVDTVVVYDHPNAPLEALEPGISLPLHAETPNIDVDQHVRVVGKSESPQKSDRAVLTVVRELQA